MGRGRRWRRGAWTGTAWSALEREHELPDRARIAVREAAVLAVEQLERVRHAERLEVVREGLRPEVEVVLVAAAGVEVDPPHRAQRVGVAGCHADRVLVQPL